MKFLRNASALALVAIVSGTAASAYTLQQAAKPAEYPPASYRGDVYVDSRGCAYVRANIGTAVNWVPRLSSDRKSVVCGLTPTANVSRMASARPPAPPAPPPATAMAPAPTPAAAPAPAAPPATAAPAASTAIARTMTVTCPAPGSTARVRIGSDTVSVQCAPGQTTAKSYIVRHGNGERTRLIAQPAAAPAPVVTAARAPAATAPATSSARVRIGGTGTAATIAAPVVTSGAATVGTLRTATPTSAGGGYTFGNGYGLSSGPGAMDPVPSASGAVRRAPATGGTVVAPRGAPAPAATIAPAPATPRVVIPSGYRPAWDDDRLNPNRGPQTAYGDQQMAALLDTSKVPMEELNPAAPRGLIAQPQGSGFTLFTKSPTATAAAAAATPAAASSKRYVQVGAFTVAANAERAAAKLRAIGLPGRVAKTRSGKTVVIAGPFDSATALSNALAKARSGGFSDAFLRS